MGTGVGFGETSVGVGILVAGIGSDDGVGTGVDVGGTSVGAGVLVAGISSGDGAGSAVGVAVGPSSHADSKAAASKHNSPTHAVRRTDSLTTPPTREVTANCLLLGLAAKLRSHCTLERTYSIKLNVSVKVLDFV